MDSSAFERIGTLLEVPNEVVRDRAAKCLIDTCSDRGDLLKRALTTLSGDKEQMGFKNEAVDEGMRRAGICHVCLRLVDEEAPVSLYMKALTGILLDQKQLAAAKIAQVILAKLMCENHEAFHGFNILEIVKKQYQFHNLKTEFLDAFMRAFGLFAVRRFAADIIQECIDSFSGNGRCYLETMVPYLVCFPFEKQVIIHKFLTEECEKNRFDGNLFLMAARAFAAVAPSVSMYCGRFLEAAKKSLVHFEVVSILRPLLESIGPHPLDKVNTIIVLSEEDKRSVGTTVAPSYQSVAVQFEPSN